MTDTITITASPTHRAALNEVQFPSDLDNLVRVHTNYGSLSRLCQVPPQFLPFLQAGNAEHRMIVDAYNSFQSAKGIPSRIELL